jgi:hypothetical protein
MQLEQLLFRFVTGGKARKLLLYGCEKRSLLSQTERLTEELRAECRPGALACQSGATNVEQPSGKSGCFRYGLVLAGIALFVS